VPIADITADAVNLALDEFDQIGRDAFLQRYGIDAAKGYFVLRNGRKYDAKAVLGAAHGKLPDKLPLKHDDFYGGERAARVVRELGFQVEAPSKAAQTNYDPLSGWPDISEWPGIGTTLPNPRYATSQGVHRYDKTKAEEWVKAGKVPPPPDFSAATHEQYSHLLQEVADLALRQDLIGLRRWQKIEPKSSSRIAITDYRQLCIRALEGGPVGDLRESSPRQVMNPNGPTNLILYGPPGTGKTYATIEEAVKLCDRSVPEGGPERVKERYDALVRAKRIEFVTFHQSYSYEDFVEGLRPEAVKVSDADEAPTPVGGFNLVATPGIFYRIAKAALANRGAVRAGAVPRLNKDRRVFKMSLGPTWTDEGTTLFRECIEGGYVLLGWGGDVDWSGPEYGDVQAIRARWIEENPEARASDSNIRQLHRLRNVLKERDLVIISLGNLKFRAIGEVTGPYQYVAREEEEYFHRRAVHWLWHDNAGLPREQIYSREFTQHSIYQLDTTGIEWEALEQIVAGGGQVGDRSGAPEPYVLIIDEINRADISKVFGELITLLEPDKRFGMQNALTVTLPYSKEQFYVPANLHVIGTMNTADRSIALLDTALRRRFRFREMMPDSAILQPVDGIDVGAALDGLNTRIEFLFDRDHQIGHAYFMNCATKHDLDAVMRDKIIPLLIEYFYEDWSKVWRALGEPEGEEGSFLRRKKLTPPIGSEDSEFNDRWRYSVRDNFADNAFEQLAK
jgi:AAA domain (dynein-related subfamily)